MADVHVVPDGNGWKVTHDGRTVSSHDTQATAEDAGRAEAKREACELVVHGTDGQIRKKESEGNDPRSTPG